MARSLPALKEFHEKHADDDRFTILAFHDTRASSLEDLDTKLTERGTREKYWGGEDLPFPILMDSTGETVKRFQIRAFPTLVLFDPEGRIVDKASLEMLEQALAGELELPEPIDDPQGAATGE